MEASWQQLTQDHVTTALAKQMNHRNNDECIVDLSGAWFKYLNCSLTQWNKTVASGGLSELSDRFKYVLRQNHRNDELLARPVDSGVDVIQHLVIVINNNKYHSQKTDDTHTALTQYVSS